MALDTTATAEKTLDTPIVFQDAAKRSKWTDVPLVSRRDAEAPTDETTLETDHSAAGALRRERVHGTSKRGKNSDTALGLGLIFGMGTRLNNFARDSVLSNTDQSTQDSVRSLQQVTGAVRSTLQMMGGLGIGLFTAEAALTTTEYRSDARRLANGGSADNATRMTAEVAEEGTEAATRGVAGGARSGFLRAAFRRAAKFVPGLNIAVNGYFTFSEVSHFADQGNTRLATAAAIVGIGETIVGTLSFGLLSDVFREGARGLFTRFGGSEYEALQRSDAVYLAQTGSQIAREEFQRVATGDGVAAPVARIVSNTIGAPNPMGGVA